MTRRICLVFGSAAITVGAASPVWAAPDAASFANILNIGDDPGAGVAFDGTTAGDDDFNFETSGFLTTDNLIGDVLGPSSQLNLFAGGTVTDAFTAGPADGTGSNTEVNLLGGGIGRRFRAHAGSTVNVESGRIGPASVAFGGSVFNVSGGQIDGGFDANAGSVINLSGGRIGSGLEANGAEINISGGEVRSGFRINGGTTVNLSGGSIGFRADANPGSTINMSGGFMDDGLHADPGSTINLFGTTFFLDGDTVSGLAIGQPLVISDRDVRLSGFLADGSFFDFRLDPVAAGGVDYFDPNATVTVTLIPAPGAVAVLAFAGLVSVSRRR